MNRTGAALLGLLGLLGMLGSPMVAARPPDAGLLAQSCSSCHAPWSTVVLPLDKLDADALEAELTAFREGTRQGTVMNRIARGYTKEQIALLARHLGRKP